MIPENLTCIARNCVDVMWVRQLTLIGTSQGLRYFMHGTQGLINNRTTMASQYGQRKFLSEYWKLATYVALLHDNPWVKRILHWNPRGGRPGPSFFQWQTPIQNVCRWHEWGDWLDITQDADLRFQCYMDFVSFDQR